VGLSEFARRSKHAARRFAICPKYSPDLDPIEMPFSKLKAGLRKAAERTISRLRRAASADSQGPSQPGMLRTISGHADYA